MSFRIAFTGHTTDEETEAKVVAALKSTAEVLNRLDGVTGLVAGGTTQYHDVVDFNPMADQTGAAEASESQPR